MNTGHHRVTQQARPPAKARVAHAVGTPTDTRTETHRIRGGIDNRLSCATENHGEWRVREGVDLRIDDELVAGIGCILRLSVRPVGVPGIGVPLAPVTKAADVDPADARIIRVVSAQCLPEGLPA